MTRKLVASSNRLIDYATNLLSDLTTDRDLYNASCRPLIFVAHSLGGFVCKRTIVLSRNNPESHLRSIFDSVKTVTSLASHALTGVFGPCFSSAVTRTGDKPLSLCCIGYNTLPMAKRQGLLLAVDWSLEAIQRTLTMTCKNVCNSEDREGGYPALGGYMHAVALKSCWLI
jgi:hypothetical protein